MLPEIVRAWLTHAGVVSKEDKRFVRLTQKGKMRLKPHGKWMTIQAIQYINSIKPAFLWKANVQLMPGIVLNGTDRFLDGKGEMHMKLLSFINVAHVLPNSKMNSATMIRYLAEFMWYPTAALHDNIRWEDIGENKAKATLSLEGQIVSGIFTFSQAGDVIGFEADWYKDTGIDATPIKWKIKVIGYKEFNDFRIPYKGEATWCLATGDFTWAVFELASLEFNMRLYP